VINYKTLDYEPWFNNELQKLVSVSASIATWAFNEKWKELNPSAKTTRMSNPKIRSIIVVMLMLCPLFSISKL